jgi:serine/threonine protein kinase
MYLPFSATVKSEPKFAIADKNTTKKLESPHILISNLQLCILFLDFLMSIAKNLYFAYNSSTMVSLRKTSDKNIKTVCLRLENGWNGKVATHRARGDSFSQNGWIQCLSKPGSLFDDVEKILKIGSKNCVAVKNLKIKDNSIKVVIKRHYAGAGFRWFFRSLRQGKALRNFKTALGLISSGFPVVTPFAALQQRCRLLTKQSIYISEYLEDSSDLHNFASKRLLSTKQADTLMTKKQLSQQIAAVLASLHKKGLWHRDSKASNFIVWKNAQDKHRILLVDMDGIKRYVLRRRNRQFRSLWQLAASLISVHNVNLTDYWRTFITYCDLTGIGQSQRRPLFRMLAKRALAKHMKNMAANVAGK